MRQLSSVSVSHLLHEHYCVSIYSISSVGQGLRIAQNSVSTPPRPPRIANTVNITVSVEQLGSGHLWLMHSDALFIRGSQVLWTEEYELF